MGGKPSKGTKADKRLKENKGKGSKRNRRAGRKLRRIARRRGLTGADE